MPWLRRSISSPEKKANVIVFVFVEISRPFSQQLFTIGYYVKVFVRTILYLLKSITGRELIIGKTLVFLPESLKLRSLRRPEGWPEDKKAQAHIKGLTE